jgi:hypothetical protein
MNESKPDKQPVVAVAAPAEGVRKALEELVRMRALHDELVREAETPIGELETKYGGREEFWQSYRLREDEYAARNPLAWSAARAALAAPPQQSGMVMEILDTLDVRRDHNYAAGADSFPITTREYAALRNVLLAAHQPGASPVEA